MMKNDQALSVAQLNQRIKSSLEGSFRGIIVSGEISGFRGAHRSGHIYCTLKDDQSTINLIIWKSTAARLRFELEEGLEVVIKGNVDVYVPRGNYQLIAESIAPQGMGALQLAYEQLKAKLAAEGLFDEEHKKPLPHFPRRIGVVTAPTGAAIRDILQVLHRRDPRVEVLIFPTPVQGDGAKEGIVSGLRFFNNNPHFRPDAVIIGRGGGSLEDLWAFNEEAVARAVFASEVPVISAVGHHYDVALSDFVADVRAATPSEAAELALPELAGIGQMVEEWDYRAREAMDAQLDELRRKLEMLASRAKAHSPRQRLREQAQQVDYLSDRLQSSMQRYLADLRGRVSGLAGRAEGLSPLKVLSRGYAVARKPDHSLIRSVKDVSTGEAVLVRLPDGELTTRVESAN